MKTITNDQKIIPKRMMLTRRMTSVDRVSIAETAAATLSFHDINYVIGANIESGKRCFKCPALPCFKSREPKQILYNASGKFINGMNAVMGKI
jgi:hypothetical protein